MANITDNPVAAGVVVASLQTIPGQCGLRLNLEIATPQAPNLAQLAFEMYPVSLEVDASKLRTLKFTQQELAEIGFGLLSRLSSLVKYDA
jgi:hypothetical protein